MISQRSVEAYVGAALLLGVRVVQQPDGQLRLAGACGGVDDERPAGMLDLGHPCGQAGRQRGGHAAQLADVCGDVGHHVEHLAQEGDDALAFGAAHGRGVRVGQADVVRQILQAVGIDHAVTGKGQHRRLRPMIWQHQHGGDDGALEPGFAQARAQCGVHAADLVAHVLGAPAQRAAVLLLERIDRLDQTASLDFQQHDVPVGRNHCQVDFSVELAPIEKGRPVQAVKDVEAVGQVGF